MENYRIRMQRIEMRPCHAFYLLLTFLLTACAPSHVSQLPSASSVPKPAQNEVSLTDLTSGTEATQSGDDCLVYEESVSGAVQVRTGNITSVDAFCYRYLTGESVLIDQARATALIRAFVGSPDLVVASENMGSSLNAPESLRVAIFQDRQGSEFMIDVANWRVVEANLGPSIPYSAPSSEMSLSELRAKAEQILAENTPTLDAMKNRFYYEEGTKSDIYFFSWEDRTYQGWLFIPPMARIAFRSDGLLVTYVNSLFLSE